MTQRAGPALPLLVVLIAGCAPDGLQPADLDTRHEACASCRMTVSDRRFASQIVAPGEETVFFDDLGCLAEYVEVRGPLPAGAVVYVADHRTRAWAPAGTAVFTRLPHVDTPMSSHLIAHASAASRDQDPDARGGTDVPRTELLGPGRDTGAR
jgi:copper chaperone NosL